jgi:hypothetical protein
MMKKVAKTMPYGDIGSLVLYDDGSMEEFEDASFSIGEKPSEEEQKAILKKYMEMMKSRSMRNTPGAAISPKESMRKENGAAISEGEYKDLKRKSYP